MAESKPPRKRGGIPRRLVRGLARLVYRDIDVRLPASAFADGPVLAVANHFGGLSDGVLLIDASPRMPRVIARDLIWKVPVVGQLATAVGHDPGPPRRRRRGHEQRPGLRLRLRGPAP